MYKLTILALIAIASFAHGQVVNPANGHTYLITSQPSNISQARAEAASLGGYLVAINSDAETAFLLANFPATEHWIGLSDEIVEGTFVWDSGEPLIYTNWLPGEPNNYGGLEDYAVVILDQFNGVTGGWNDWPTGGTAPFIAYGIIEIPPLSPDSSLYFDGLNDRVTIPSNNILSGAGDFTIEAWFKIHTQPTSFS